MTELLRQEATVGFIARRARRVYAILWRCWRGVNKAVIHMLLPLVARPRAEGLRLERIGSEYGGWTVPVDLIKEDWICYCVGVGIDATFDMALANRFGCNVFSMDPTPKSVAYMANAQYDRTRLKFLPLGVWKEDTQLKFFEPADSRHASNLSMFDLHGTGRYVSAECKRLASIMKQLGHDHIDLLKLDVEGAWEAVLRTVLEDRFLPSVLCIEMDSPVTLPRVLSMIRMLRLEGLELAHTEKDNYLFVAARK